jgi:hypothetical protein
MFAFEKKLTNPEPKRVDPKLSAVTRNYFKETLVEKYNPSQFLTKGAIYSQGLQDRLC